MLTITTMRKHIRDKIKGKIAYRSKTKAKKKVVKKAAPKAAPKPAPKPAPKAEATATKKTPIKRKPSGRAEKPEEVIKSGGGRGQGKRLFNFTPVESSGGGARTGKGKKKRDTKLFGGTFTSRGNRRR